MMLRYLADDQIGDIHTTIAATQVLSLVIGIVLPILVGIVTKQSTNPGTKAVLLALLAAISGFLSEYVAGDDAFNWTVALLTWLGTFMVAVATHFGFWKPTGVSAAAQNIGVTDHR